MGEFDDQPRSEPLGPITSTERIELIDAVRGFALFGVLLANMVWLSQDVAMTPERLAVLPTAQIDSIAKHAVLFFIDWKFITLFSFLFGLGFSVQMIRAEERGQAIVGTYARRLAVLFLFGVIHAYVFWYGDILHHYAVLGFFLILFYKASDRTLLIAAALFAVVIAPIAHHIVVLQPPPPPPAPGTPSGAEVRLAAFLSGDIRQVMLENIRFMIGGFWSSGVFAFILSQAFGKFLLGFYVGRRRLLQDASEHLALYRKLLWWGLILGLICNGTWVLTDILMKEKLLAPTSTWMLPARFLIYIGTIALAAFYLSSIVLLYQRPKWKKRIAWLAPVGRMALTNYLMHTVLNLLIFYGYGIGLLGEVGAAFCVLLSLAIFALQIIYSPVWLRRFRFGPAEWLWRLLTYGKFQSMR